MPSWSSLLQGVVLAGLAVTGLTLAPAWSKTNVDVPREDVAPVEATPMGAVANVDMIDPVGTIESTEDVDPAHALVAAADPVEIRSEERPTKSEADVGSPSKKDRSESSRSSRSKAVRTSSEELDLGPAEAGGAPSDSALAVAKPPVEADCPLDPSACSPPEQTGAPAGAPPSKGSTEPGVPDRPLFASIRAGIDAVKDEARACGPRHGAKHDEKVFVELEFDGKSGTVQSATPREPHADTPLGSCVAEVLASVEVNEFKRYRHSIEYWIEM